MDYIEHLLKLLKQYKKIVDYRIDGNNVYVSPIVPIDYIEVKFKVSSDGDAMVSTGVDSRDGSTVGDDRKSSK